MLAKISTLEVEHGTFCFEHFIVNRARAPPFYGFAKKQILENGEIKMYINQKEIGHRIRSLRKENRLSQEELANKLNVNTDHVGRVETGNRGMSIDLLVEISKYFAVSTDYILFGQMQNTDEIKEIISFMIFRLKEIERKL